MYQPSEFPLDGEFSFHKLGQCLIVSVPADLFGQRREAFQRFLLNSIQHERLRGLILDLSGVELCDVEDFRALQRTIAMTSLMGTRSILVGLKPTVVQILIESDQLEGLDALEVTRNVQDALELLKAASLKGTR
ncbi:MAG: STAS domain-containing protein [Myxococcota bacterium]